MLTVWCFEITSTGFPLCQINFEDKKVHSPSSPIRRYYLAVLVLSSYKVRVFNRMVRCVIFFSLDHGRGKGTTFQAWTQILYFKPPIRARRGISKNAPSGFGSRQTNDVVFEWTRKISRIATKRVLRNRGWQAQKSYLTFFQSSPPPPPPPTLPWWTLSGPWPIIQLCWHFISGFTRVLIPSLSRKTLCALFEPKEWTRGWVVRTLQSYVLNQCMNSKSKYDFFSQSHQPSFESDWLVLLNSQYWILPLQFLLLHASPLDSRWIDGKGGLFRFI